MVASELPAPAFAFDSDHPEKFGLQFRQANYPDLESSKFFRALCDELVFEFQNSSINLSEFKVRERERETLCHKPDDHP